MFINMINTKTYLVFEVPPSRLYRLGVEKCGYVILSHHGSFLEVIESGRINAVAKEHHLSMASHSQLQCRMPSFSPAVPQRGG